MLVDSTKRDKPLPVISIIETMKIPVLTWNDIANPANQSCFHKAGFSVELSDEGIEDDPFFAFKQSLDEI